MKYHCTWCDYIYDELKWDSEEDIPPLTFFDSLPNDFFCPYCDTHKDDFTVFEEIVNIPTNNSRLTNLEAEHFPVYSISWDILSFEIWQTEHPLELDHFIYKVELYDESSDLIEFLNFKNDQKAIWKFDIEYLDKFEIRVYCNKEWIFSTWLLEREELDEEEIE